MLGSAKYVIIAVVLLYTLTASSQHTHALKWIAFTVHPFGDSYAHLQPLKLTPQAHVVLNYGLLYEYEKFIYGDQFSLKTMTALAADCSRGWAFGNLIGLKAYAIKTKKHRLGVALGPMIMIRESWERFENYTASERFSTSHTKMLGPIQHVFFPCAVTVDYDIRFHPKWDYSITFTPGIPYVLTFAFGVKYWPTRDFKPVKPRLARP